MERTQKSRVIDMTKGDPAHLLLVFALPLFFGNLLQQFYNLADTSIAGHILGDNALAQIGATSALYSLITNFAFGLNNGLALMVSRYFGADDRPRLLQSVCWMTTLSLIFSLLLTAGFLALRYPLLILLQVPPEIMDGAMEYLTVILAGIPLTMAYNLEAGLLRSVGNSVTPLLLLLFSSLLNIGLDIWFMGPLDMGVRGAAVATVLSQGISAVLGLLYIIRCYAWLRFGRRQWQASPKFVLEMLTTGLSMALMGTIYNIGSVTLQSSINALGETSIASQVGARRLAELFYLPGAALSTSMATYASQNYGARKRRRIAEGIRTTLFLYTFWWITAIVITFAFADSAIRLITGTSSQEVVRSAELYLHISIPLMPPMAVLVILRNTLQGMGQPFMPLFCSTLELAGKVIFAFFAVPVWGYLAVCICEPVTWVICVACISGWTFLHRAEFRDEPGMPAQP